MDKPEAISANGRYTKHYDEMFRKISGDEEKEIQLLEALEIADKEGKDFWKGVLNVLKFWVVFILFVIFSCGMLMLGTIFAPIPE